MNDYYADLGVARDATAEDIKHAYRRSARRYHPDVNPGPEAEEQFKKLSQAYDVLSDPDKRQAYDHGSDPYGSGAAGFGQGFSFSDIMDAFFGGQAGTAGRGPRSRTTRGQDALVRLDIDLGDAVFGAQKDLTIDTAVACSTCRGAGMQPGTSTRTCDVCARAGRDPAGAAQLPRPGHDHPPVHDLPGLRQIITDPCYECSGDGRVRTRRTLTLKVPAGVDTGTRIQLAGEGEVGHGAGPAGDLYVEVAVNRHPVFQRRGDDLHATVEVPMTAAALGATLAIDTFDGARDLDIRRGTQSGDSITLRGLGVTHLRGNGRGDVVVHAMVQTPTRLDAEQEDLLRRLATSRGEERPEGRVANPADGSIFGKLRDAFKTR